MSSFSLTKSPSEVMQSVAERVKLLRKKQRMSQSELAERSGVSFGSIKRFETKGEISFESLLKIAKVLNRIDDFDAVFAAQDDLERIEKLFTPKSKE